MKSSIAEMVGDLPSTPPHQPLPMPDQDLGRGCGRPATGPFEVRTWLARVVVAMVFAGLTGYGGYQMWQVIDGVGGTWLQWIWFGLFVVSFGWIALSAGNAVAGLTVRRSCLSGAGVRLPAHRTALIMPVHNEEPSTTFANLEAMALGLAEGPGTTGFEIFILSDTRDPDVWARETAAYRLVQERLRGVIPVWYRRRSRQDGHKAGNVRSFIETWGARYDYMIVLDADSLMAPSTIARLVESMDADSNLGILQTVPALQGGEGLLARIQQFAAAAYGPVTARGLAAWQADAASFWGHNAIIRVRAFAEACGIPRLPGRPPFGGHVLSHDFLESALIRRSGWQVRILPDLGGSWETAPPTLLDLAARDRRWAQGNLQHARFLGRGGWAWPNRVHFLTGIMGYLASPLWLAWIGVGLFITVQAASTPPAYFPETFQLFPDWPRFDAGRMASLLMYCIAVLGLPKLIGLAGILASPARRAGFGGTGRVLLSAGVEMLMSALWAPVRMATQTQQICEILLGKDAGWSAQRRTPSGGVDWRDVWSRYGRLTVFGVGLIWVLAWTAPWVLAWLSPTLLGWTLAVPLSGLSGSVRLGRALRRKRVLLTPDETFPDPLVAAASSSAVHLADRLNGFGVAALLQNPEARARHLSAASPPPPAPRGCPDLVVLSAAAKVADVRSLPEALNWLRPDEWMTVLSDRRLLDDLAAASEGSAPPDNRLPPSEALPTWQGPPLPCI